MAVRLERGHFFGRTVHERSGHRDHSCGEGTLVLNTVGAEHSDLFEADRTDVLNVEFHPEWMVALREDGWRDSGPVWVEGRHVLSRIRSLRHQLARSENLSSLVIEGLCAELLDHAARARVTGRRRSPPVWLAVVEHVLHERFRHPPSLLELGRLTDLSPSRLARGFRAQHGCSIGVFIRRLRVERAREVVVGTRRPLAEIAFEVGYADQSHREGERGAGGSSCPSTGRADRS